MIGEKETIEARTDDQAEMLLKQLMHLKQYETPDVSRMVRNKQNIMRQVRNSQAQKRKPLLDRIEINIPWFFAEPKFGLAALFVSVVGLQYVGITSNNSARSTGIYSAAGSMASYENLTEAVTNQYSYPDLPSSYQLFDTPQGDQSVVPVSFEMRR